MKKILSFVAIVLLFGCTSQNNKDIFKEARQHLSRQEFPEAVSNLKEILSTNPDKETAFKAALEIAKVYHAHAIKSIPNDESLKIAVEYYKRANKIDPKAEEAPKALFLAGFIEANQLNDLTAARATYNKFIKMYPDNPMVESAKKEIQNLGVPPEKIIEKSLAPNELKKR